MLRRLSTYSEKVFHLSREGIAGIVDRRPPPRILTARIVQSVAAWFRTRTGSLHAQAWPDSQGIAAAILDGHASHASFRRHCAGCFERTIHTEQGDHTQFCHRQVTLMLLPGAPGREPIRLLRDHEPQLCWNGCWRPTRGPLIWS